jgi:hypothetical protein
MKLQLLAVVILVMSPWVMPTAWASDVYKCKDKNGKLNYTDSPCPQAAKMLPYSKTTQQNHEFRMKKAAQEKRFRSETYRQTTVLMPSY